MSGSSSIYILPRVISGLEAHWDYYSTRTTTIVANKFSEITDLSLNGHDLVQATDGNRPIVGSINGRPAGLGPDYGNSILYNIPGGMTVRTIVFVADYSLGFGRNWVSPFGSPSNDGPHSISSSTNWSGTGPYWDTSRRWNNGTETDTLTLNDVPFVEVIERTSSAFRSNWRFFNNNGGGSWSGHIGEFIVYNKVLSDGERNALVNSLMYKWGIT